MITDVDNYKKIMAVEKYLSVFNSSCNLGLNYQRIVDSHFKIMDEPNAFGYVEVVVRLRTMRDSYPLPIEVSKLSRLIAKRLNPVVIWSCEDGIIYAKAEDLRGEILMNYPSPGIKSKELMAYYERQKVLRYVRY